MKYFEWSVHILSIIHIKPWSLDVDVNNHCRKKYIHLFYQTLCLHNKLTSCRRFFFLTQTAEGLLEMKCNIYNNKTVQELETHV